MSRCAARSQDSFLDHDSSLEDATAADLETDAAPRRAATSGATPTNSASRREKTASGFFSFFRWFRKGRGDDVDSDEETARDAVVPDVALPPTPSSVRLVRSQSSSCGSIDTLFSTATVSSFSFVTPAVYRPYGAASVPEKWIAPGPETDTYRNRLRQREKLREQDRGITLRRKYHLFGSDTQLRHGPTSPQTSPQLGARVLPPSPRSAAPVPAPVPPSSPTSSNSTFGRKKRRAPAPPEIPKTYSDYSLPSSWRKDKVTDQEDEGSAKKKRHRRAASESAKDRKAGAYCHVKGKRKAPPPPSAAQSGAGGSLDRFRARVASFGRKKRPAPQPPTASGASPAEQVSLADASGVVVRRPKKDQETQAKSEESAGSINKLSPEDRERLIDNISKLKAHANRRSMGSPPVAKKDFHVGLSSGSDTLVCNDSLKLERGVLKPNKDMPKVETSSPAAADGKPAPVSPRPWYKRSLSSSKDKESSGGLTSGLRRDIFKSLEKRKDREKEEEWMPEAGIPRSAGGAPPPSDGTSVSSTTSTASASSSRFNFFSRLDRSGDDKRAAGGEKRRSQLSMLANISELDREAAEIVQKEQAREQALAAAHDAKFYSYPEMPGYPALYPGLPSSLEESTVTPPPSDNVEVPKRSSAKELISLFNAIGNVTKVTVNTSFFSREGSGFFSREGVEKRLQVSNGESVKSTTTMEEKVVVRDSTIVIKQQSKQTTVEGISSPQVRRRAGSSSSDVVIEELPEEQEEEEDAAGARSRALYEAGRARRHHSPSPSIPTIAEQSESTTPASTLDPNSNRSSMVESSAQVSVTAAFMTATSTSAVTATGSPDVLQQAKRINIWTCPRCTLENPRWRITCDACGRWRPSVPDNKETEATATNSTSSSAPSTPTTLSTPVTLSSLLASPIPSISAPVSTSSHSSSKVESHTPQEDKSDKKAGKSESPGANGKGPIDWEEELKHYFPKGSASQSKAKTSAIQTAETHQKEARMVVQNGIKESIVHTDNKSNAVEEAVVEKSKKLEIGVVVNDTKATPKIAMPSTFIGGRTKADEKRQGTSPNSSPSGPTAAASPPSAAASPPKKADIDEVRKARLAFFNKGDSTEESSALSQKTSDGNGKEKGKGKGKGEAIYAGLKLPKDEKEKKKLKEMLKEMKDSLPRYPKNLTNGNQDSDISKAVEASEKNETVVLTCVTESGRDEGYKRGAIKKIPQSSKEGKTKHIINMPNGSDKKVEAIFVTSKTVVEETKVRKSSKVPKVSTSCQTSSVVKKVEAMAPSIGSSLPVTVEELWESGVKDGVLYTSLGKPVSAGSAPSANSSLRAFELIRARDFATIEATKTALAGAGGTGGTAAAHVYANVPASPRARRSAFQPGASAPQPSPPPPPPPQQQQPAAQPPQQQPTVVGVARGQQRDAAPSAFVSAAASVGSDAATSSSPPESPPPEASSCSVVSGGASDSSEVERLTAQLTLPKGLADFKADLQAQPQEHNVNTLAVNRLLRRLEAAIAGGQHHQAAVLARDLARLKISCSVTRQRRSITASPASITVDMYVEDKVSHQGPIPLQVIPGMTVAELKQKVEQEFEIPVGVQRWILGKMLASDDEKTLEDHNVNSSGCPMFLYLVAPDGDQEGEGFQTQPEQEVQETRLPSPSPPTLPPPPPAEKGGGWYYNHEDDRYSFCEDTESEVATDDDGDDERSEGPGQVTINIPKEQTQNTTGSDIQKNGRNGEINEQEEEEGGDGDDDDDDDDEDEEEEGEAFKEKLTLVQPSAVIIHDRPVVIEAPAAVVDQKRDIVPTNLGLPTKSNADIGTMKLGWKCPVCTLVNSPTRPGCAACTTERPVQYVVPTAYKASPHEVERIRKEVQGDQDLLKAEAKAKEQNEQNVHYQELVNLDNTDLVPNTEPFECSVCFTPYGRQEGVILRDCLHVFCKPCLANTVQFNEEAEVKCPYRDHDYACDSVLQEREIKALVPKQIYEQHLAKSVAQAENKIGNAFHCKTPDCRGWCIFEDNVNEFRCPVCRVINCLTCQAIHEGINCKQYQEQVQQQSETNAEARRTKEMLEEMVVRGEAMACPTCQVVLMKKWGCDWLRCSMCKTEICWVTRGPRWGPGGKGDTTGGCQCGVNGVKCHPRCNYCH